MRLAVLSGIVIGCLFALPEAIESRGFRPGKLLQTAIAGVVKAMHEGRNGTGGDASKVAR